VSDPDGNRIEIVQYTERSPQVAGSQVLPRGTALLAAMMDRMSIQYRMGSPASRIDCLWVVERENDYAGDLL
jgi:hypothetical protein